jgi:hypothetical protein
MLFVYNGKMKSRPHSCSHWQTHCGDFEESDYNLSTPHDDHKALDGEAGPDNCPFGGNQRSSFARYGGCLGDGEDLGGSPGIGNYPTDRRSEHMPQANR